MKNPDVKLHGVRRVEGSGGGWLSRLPISRGTMPLVLGFMCCAATSFAASSDIVFDWQERHSSTPTILHPDIDRIPHPGHDYPSTHPYYTQGWLAHAAADRHVGLMLQTDTGPFDGSTNSNALNEVIAWIDANDLTLDYVFSDVENDSNVSLVFSNASLMVDIVRSHSNPKINQARCVQYPYWPGEIELSAHFVHLKYRSGSIAEYYNNIGHDWYMNSGVDVANPNCYFYSYFNQHAPGGPWSSQPEGTCPDVRSSMFWAPLERFCTAKRALPAGHQIIPWLSGLIPVSGYPAPDPTSGDRRSLLQHMRLRGSDGYYRLAVFDTALTEEEHKAELLDAWHDLDAFFANSGPLEILEMETDKNSGVNFSASRKGNRTHTLVSNLSGSSAAAAFTTDEAAPELPAAAPSVPAGEHERFEYLVYRPMDESFESYTLSLGMDQQGFQGPTPNRMQVFAPTGAGNGSARAMGPVAGMGAAETWWMTAPPGLASNEVAVYSAKLFGSTGVGFSPVAVDAHVVANNGATAPDTARQGTYTAFSGGEIVSRQSYSVGDTYEATNYSILAGRWYEVQVVRDGTGGSPVTRTYVRDLSTGSAWTQLVFDNRATGGVESLTELPAVSTALANPSTYNGWQVYGADDTCRVDDLWASLYPWVDGGDRGPAELFYVSEGPAGYALTVINGTGSGTFLEGVSVPIAETASGPGQAFSSWTGDTQYVDNPSAPVATVTMPGTNIAVTASYVAETTYPLTVNSGSGDGLYIETAVVPIAADAPPTNGVFDAWTGDVAYVGDPSDASTTVTMPAGPATVTATYAPVEGVTLLDPSNLMVTAMSETAGSEVIHAFNGDGLSGDLHDNNVANMWRSLGYNLDGKWIKVDLGGTTRLDRLKVWNLNESGGEWRGLQQADVYVALSDPGNNVHNSGTPFDTNGWTLAVADQLFAKSPGGATIGATDALIDLGGVQAAFMALRVDANYFTGSEGWPGDLGLSEVQIFAGQPVPDHDYDTLPTDWEQGTGLDPLDDGSVDPDQGADGDPDLDDATNREEYIADTHPNDSNSFFAITGTVSQPDGSVDVQVESSSARVYLLQGAGDLGVPLPWPVLEGPTAGTGGAMTFNDATTDGAAVRAYSVEVQLP